MTTVRFCKRKYFRYADILEDRFYNSMIIGIQKLHSFIPVFQTEVEIKTVSTQYEGKIVRITKYDYSLKTLRDLSRQFMIELMVRMCTRQIS